MFVVELVELPTVWNPAIIELCATVGKPLWEMPVSDNTDITMHGDWLALAEVFTV